VDHLKPVVAFAESMIGNLNGRDIVITDGLLDPQLQLAARQAGVDVNMLNLQAGRSREQAEHQARVFDDEESKSLALVGLPAALRDWVARDPQAMDRLALLASPDLLRLPSVAIRPGAFFYVLHPAAETADAEALLDRMLAERNQRVVKIPDGLGVDDAGWFQLQFMNRWFSRLANDTGFLLDQQKAPALAVEAYRLAVDIWPENPSAVVNLLADENLADDDPERQRLNEVLSGLVAENPRTMNVRYLHAVSGRLANPAAMMAYIEQSGGVDGGEDVLDGLATRLQDGDEVSLFNLARLYLQDRNPDQSEAIFRSMLETNPQNLDAHYGLFRVAMARGEGEEAERLLSALEALGADPVKLELDRAALLLAQGQLEEAKRIYLAASRREQPSPEAWMGLVQTGIRQDDQDVIDLAFAGLERERNYVPGLIMLGERAILNRRPAEARAYYQRALALDDANERALIRLLQIAFDLRDAASLRQYSGSLLAIQPEHPFGNLMAAYVHIAGEDYAAAEAALRRSLRARENAQALNELAWVLLQQERYADALDPARRAVALNPENANAANTLAVILYRLNMLDEAVQNSEKAVELAAGNSPSILLYAAEIYIAADRFEEAENALRMPDETFAFLTPEQVVRWRELSEKLAE
jgi:tetratricopeptide (TPR) repeat protein